jgi:hypothetical protein
MIEVRLFGELRRYAIDRDAPSGVSVQLPVEGIETVCGVLARLGVDPSEVGHIFLNGRLLPRSHQPVWWGYQLAAPAPLSREDSLCAPVAAGDRLGVFERKMGLVVV